MPQQPPRMHGGVRGFARRVSGSSSCDEASLVGVRERTLNATGPLASLFVCGTAVQDFTSLHFTLQSRAPGPAVARDGLVLRLSLIHI